VTRSGWALAGLLLALVLLGLGWWIGHGVSTGIGAAFALGFTTLLADAEASARRAAASMREPVVTPVELDDDVREVVASTVIDDSPLEPPSSAYLNRLSGGS